MEIDISYHLHATFLGIVSLWVVAVMRPCLDIINVGKPTALKTLSHGWR